jgi:hypothetical protein
MGFQGSMQDYNVAKEFQQSKDAGKIGNEESDKFEIDFSESLDEFYHELLGEKLVNGVWVKDFYMKKWINRSGASIVMKVIKSLINKNMNFASYNDQELREIISYQCEKLSPLIFCDGDILYDIPKTDDQDLLMQMVFGKLWELGTIARGGHMTIYRGEKTKTIISKQEANPPVGAY